MTLFWICFAGFCACIGWLWIDYMRMTRSLATARDVVCDLAAWYYYNGDTSAEAYRLLAARVENHMSAVKEFLVEEELRTSGSQSEVKL